MAVENAAFWYSLPVAREHSYTSRIIWTGNRGRGTAEYLAYDRTWDIRVTGKPVVHCSNDPLLGGDASKLNPEDLLLSALSACHMLWYLHLASRDGLVVTGYHDEPTGEAETEPNGAGHFVRATLRPTVHVPAGTDLQRADSIHGEIHRYCFIARSVSFPVGCKAQYVEE